MRFHVMLRFKGAGASQEKYVDFDREPTQDEFLLRFSEQIAPMTLDDIELMSVMALPPAPVPKWLDRRFTGEVISGLYGDKKVLERFTK